MTIHRFMAASAVAVLLAGSVAVAQTPAPVRMRGTIDSVSGSTLNVTTRDGAKKVIKLADNAPVGGVAKASLSDVKQGGFVGITAMPQADGTQKAVEIHIFPEAARGTGEGHRPWDLMPNSTMTNATVDSEVTISDGQKLVLKYKDGEKTFIVPSNVVVVSFVPATAADLKPGVKFFVAGGTEQPDGSIAAPRINVGLNGITPPM
ncbi:MAG TPA: hypothetical protein VH206_02315 [Xanthobacteraceae bacterium]|jgi:hypothetical protein|nr:hypothetical protein [Xanthobacteraceae bacterium]